MVLSILPIWPDWMGDIRFIKHASAKNVGERSANPLKMPILKGQA